jgi:uncharacterized membrane protein
MRLALRIAGIVVILAALFFVVGGFVTFWSDADLDRSGKLLVGFMYITIGLLIAFGGWKLLRRSR